MNAATAVYQLVNHAWRQFGGTGETDVIILRKKDEKHIKIRECVRTGDARCHCVQKRKPEGLGLRDE